MSNPPAIVWLRHDLRIADNPALHAARESGAPVIPVFVLDGDGRFAPGGAQRWWLHHSLVALADDLEAAGATLVLRRGSGPAVVRAIVAETGAAAVYWNRRYDKAGVAADKALKENLTADGVSAQSFNGALLREPWELRTGSGGWYKVFTPFWRALSAAGPARAEPAPAVRKIEGPARSPATERLADWGLLPTKPDWAAEFGDHWTPGERGARKALDTFLRGPVDNYDEDRNRPDKTGTSRLSPHLAFGEISPLQIWTETHARIEKGDIPEGQATKFLSEIAWREFSYNLLFNFEDLPTAPLREEFANFPWRDDATGFHKWARGQTGFPVVDAGMRELWRTGWMHNRVRMIVASFLVKNMLVDWRDGERWFWDTLLDADPANNTASWQWVAGSGADAAPYFRIFNPETQSEKFDPHGNYIREFVPELKAMPDKHIHAPAAAPPDVLKKAGVEIGADYPAPMLDLKSTRQRALDAYNRIRKG